MRPDVLKFHTKSYCNSSFLLVPFFSFPLRIRQINKYVMQTAFVRSHDITQQKTKRDHRINGGGKRVFLSNKMETETETGNASKCKNQSSKKHYGRKRRYGGNQFTNKEGNPKSKKTINNDAPVRRGVVSEEDKCQQFLQKSY